MDKKDLIQQYINNFRRHISNFLKPGVGIEWNIYPAKEEGAILEILLGENIQNNDNFLSPDNTVNDALKKIEQHAFGGNLSSFNFKGTNIIMEKPNRIILIKGEDNISEWNDDSSIKDIKRIIEGYKSE